LTSKSNPTWGKKNYNKRGKKRTEGENWHGPQQTNKNRARTKGNKAGTRGCRKLGRAESGRKVKLSPSHGKEPTDIPFCEPREWGKAKGKQGKNN